MSPRTRRRADRHALAWESATKYPWTWAARLRAAGTDYPLARRLLRASPLRTAALGMVPVWDALADPCPPWLAPLARRLHRQRWRLLLLWWAARTGTLN